MSERINIRPSRDGLLVPIPGARRNLDPNGEYVQSSQYWYRALRRGDVVMIADASAEDRQPELAPQRKKKE